MHKNRGLSGMPDGPITRKRGDECKKRRLKTGANAKRGQFFEADTRITGGLG